MSELNETVRDSKKYACPECGSRRVRFKRMLFVGNTATMLEPFTCYDCGYKGES